MTPFSGEKPQRGVRLTFSALVDPFITWFLGTFWDELQAVIAAFNFNATNATSVTSLTVGSGANKSLTTQTGKSYNEAMTIKVAYKLDPTIWMLGDLISYDSGTGALVFYPRTKNGSGTYADWVIAQSPTADEVGDLVCTCSTGNGSGSTLTTVRLMTTTVVNSLGATVTHSATNGTSITLPEAGIYEVYAQDHYTGGAPASPYWGIGKNITTGISTALNAGTLCLTAPESVSVTALTRTFYGAAGDVIRLMNNGNYYNGVDYVLLSVRKISNG